jgi:mannose-6-phosphate isomerase-like protein (cupin superfamily)
VGHIRLADIAPVRAFEGVAHRLAVSKTIGATGIQMGEIILEPGAIIPRHHHDVDDAMLIIGGRGVCRLGDEIVPVEPGTAVVAPAGTVHGLENTGSEALRVVFAWPTADPVARYWAA